LSGTKADSSVFKKLTPTIFDTLPTLKLLQHTNT
jgi:hypothetical protein